jgi:hypothetical protein
MEKSKIIEYVLNEWAMRSPDGLASGHDTPENISILNEILAERDEINPLASKYFEKKGGLLVAKNHPLYQDGTSIEMIKSGQAAKKWHKTFGAKAKWDVNFLTQEKGFNQNSAEKIIDALDELSAQNKMDFLEHLDNETPESAVSYINEKIKQSDFLNFMKALDGARSSAKKADSTGSAGRGEYIIVLLIKDAKSAGTKSGDILLPDGRKIDVKEGSDIFRITVAAFGKGGFDKVPYIRALTELMEYCRKDEYQEALIDLLKESGAEDGLGSLGKKRSDYTATEDFIKNPSLFSLGVSVIYGLETLRLYVRGLSEKEYGTVTGTEKVEFDLDDSTKVLKLKDLDAENEKKIKEPAPEGSTVQIKVSPIEKQARKMEIIIPQIKRLEFFKYHPQVDKDIYDPVKVASEMLKAVSSSGGSYTGGIILFKENGTFEYESNLENWFGDWMFYGYAQSGPVLIKRKSSGDVQ